MKRQLLIDYALIPKRPVASKLRKAAAQAVAFEHAIIPLYLYALYSLDARRNAQVADLVESVVRDEMLHMILACNLLNALGGSPDLQSPKFVPNYPCALPGTLAAGMTVGLARFSIKQVREIFMTIERPDRALTFPSPEQYGLKPKKPLGTVGDFYRGIRDQIRIGGNCLFTGCPSRQVTDPRMPDLIAITNTKTASEAIETIIEQGEGTLRDPRDDAGDYAHYYKFQQIAKLRRLQPNPRVNSGTPARRRHRFTNPIAYDWTAVWRVPTNPKAANYPPGSKARRACENFNYTYTCLLRTLHRVVNGQPQELPASFGLMFSLKQQAVEMMSGESTGGVPTGPSFEYQPVNPDPV